ncbi:MAG: 30S ribosomal protein S20, partial [Pedobacter agri]
MANHKSSLKRIRANATKRLRNRYQAKTTRTFIKRLRAAEDKKSASDLLPKV